MSALHGPVGPTLLASAGNATPKEGPQRSGGAPGGCNSLCRTPSSTAMAQSESKGMRVVKGRAGEGHVGCKHGLHQSISLGKRAMVSASSGVASSGWTLWTLRGLCE